MNEKERQGKPYPTFRELKIVNSETSVVQKTHEFTLTYTGVKDLTDEFVNAMYEAGCDDALIGMRDGFFFADFGRSAPTFREALISAIEDIERSGQATPTRPRRANLKRSGRVGSPDED